jgi:hypothetical protein
LRSKPGDLDLQRHADIPVRRDTGWATLATNVAAQAVPCALAEDGHRHLERQPRPFTWTKTADEILKSLTDYLARVGTGHRTRKQD